MTVQKTVADDQVRIKPTDEQIATYARREHELKERFLRGVRSAQGILAGLQVLIERDFESLVNTGEFSIQIPALPRPTLAELRVGRSFESIERDVSTVEPVTLTLATVLQPNEVSIPGDEYERRLMSAQPLLLGYQHLQWLLSHQQEFPAFMALLGRRICIDFPGLVVVDSGGLRNYPYAADGGKQWGERWYWTGSDFDRRGRVAVSRE